MNLKKKYKNFTLENINFTIQKGEIVSLVGANGAGKSTIMKLILNLIKKDEGTIKIFGKDNIKFENEVKNRIGFIFEIVDFYDSFTIKELVSFIKYSYSNWDMDKYYYFIDKFKLNPNIKIKELSKGTKTKLLICIALSHNAEFFIMDEPTSGLDIVTRENVLNIFYDLAKNEGKTILFSSHITNDIEKLADKIMLVKEGKIVFNDIKQNLNQNGKSLEHIILEKLR